LKTISAAAQKAQPGDIVTWLRQPDIEVPQAPNPPRKPADDAPQAELDKYTATLADHKKAMETWTLQVKPEADRKQTEFNSAMAKTLEASRPRRYATTASMPLCSATPREHFRFPIQRASWSGSARAVRSSGCTRAATR
jgi:hypothetical protein